MSSYQYNPLLLENIRKTARRFNKEIESLIAHGKGNGSEREKIEQYTKHLRNLWAKRRDKFRDNLTTDIITGKLPKDFDIHHNYFKDTQDLINRNFKNPRLHVSKTLNTNFSSGNGAGVANAKAIPISDKGRKTTAILSNELDDKNFRKFFPQSKKTRRHLKLKDIDISKGIPVYEPLLAW